MINVFNVEIYNEEKREPVDSMLISLTKPLGIQLHRQL